MEPDAAELVGTLATALAPSGMNLVGAAAVETYDAGVPATYALRRLWPAARTALVIGNGGGALWSAFRGHCRDHPGWEHGPDPLDRFTQATIERIALPILAGRPCQVLFPFRFPSDPVAFVHLAECAGLARRSLVGVVVHPVYGPWVALRAAILVPDRMAAPRPADGFDPCPTCVERACLSPCPVGAVGGGGWDVARCATHRLGADDRCGSRCHARFDCVIGREHRYPAEALAYHQAHARRSMASLPPPVPAG